MALDPTGAEERSGATPKAEQPAQNEEQRRPVIGVIGDGQPGSDRERMAAEVGAALARAGVHLVCGGLGGCMAGASRGYKEANGAGICLGILPGTSRNEANPWVDLAIPTGVNSAQGALVAMAAHQWWVALPALGVRMLAGALVGAVILKDRNVLLNFWLIPLRDLIGFSVWLGGLFGHTVQWRDRELQLRPDGRILEEAPEAEPLLQR